MTLLCDIGGTYARFGILEEATGNITHFEKRTVQGNDIYGLICSYAHDFGLEGGRIALATAAWPEGDPDVLHYRSGAILSLHDLRRGGWNIACRLNDFEASAYGAYAYNGEGQHILKQGVQQGHTCKCIIGPGTGLGLAYINEIDGIVRVRESFGGHMIAAAQTPAQFDLLQKLKPHMDQDTVIFENVVSGDGLKLMINSLYDLEVDHLGDMFTHLNAAQVKTVLKHFHEFLGLFAHQALLYGHAFGGLILHGGLLDRLFDTGKFDFDSFHAMLDLDVRPAVREALHKTPISYISDTWLALHGLKAYLSQ